MVLGNLFASDWASLLELPPVLGCNIQLLTTVQQLLRQLRVVGAVVAIEQRSLPQGQDRLCNIHIFWEVHGEPSMRD